MAVEASRMYEKHTRYALRSKLILQRSQKTTAYYVNANNEIFSFLFIECFVQNDGAAINN